MKRLVFRHFLIMQGAEKKRRQASSAADAPPSSSDDDDMEVEQGSSSTEPVVSVECLLMEYFISSVAVVQSDRYYSANRCLQKYVQTPTQEVWDEQQGATHLLPQSTHPTEPDAPKLPQRLQELRDFVRSLRPRVFQIESAEDKKKKRRLWIDDAWFFDYDSTSQELSLSADPGLGFTFSLQEDGTFLSENKRLRAFAPDLPRLREELEVRYQNEILSQERLRKFLEHVLKPHSFLVPDVGWAPSRPSTAYVDTTSNPRTKDQLLMVTWCSGKDQTIELKLKFHVTARWSKDKQAFLLKDDPKYRVYFPHIFRDEREKEPDALCSVCMERPKDSMVACGPTIHDVNHAFCSKCIGSFLRSENDLLLCPLCRRPFVKMYKFTL